MKLKKCITKNVNILLSKLQLEFKKNRINWGLINEISSNYVGSVKNNCHTAIVESNKFLGNNISPDYLKQEYKRLLITQLDKNNGNCTNYLRYLHQSNCANIDLKFKTEQYLTQFDTELKQSYRNLRALCKTESVSSIETSILSDTMSASRNYRIQDNDLEIVSPKSKYLKNIAAIKLLKRLDLENRQASLEEQKILVQYSGFGGLSKVFINDNETGRPKEFEELRTLVSDKEFEMLRASTLNAHYTPKHVIKSIYTVLSRMGFNEGTVLEPAMGTGCFVGLTPKDWNIKFHGVEIDPITGSIAKHLYPEANIQICPFEKSKHRMKYDLILSNVPFGDYRVFDPDYSQHKLLIHDYFIIKGLDMLRNEGIMAVITTKGTLDKKNSKVRQLIEKKATLIGAIRLPNTTFKVSSNTEVTTDILFLKKHSGDNGKEQSFINVIAQNDYFINEYYAKNPHMMLGTMKKDINMYGGENTTLNACDNWEELLQCTMAENFPQEIYKPLAKMKKNILTQPSERPSSLDVPEDVIVKNYQYVMIDESIYQREDDKLHYIDLSGKKYERMVGLIKLRDAAIEYIDGQGQQISEYEFEIMKKKINTIYDSFVKANGYVNDRSNISLFREDPEMPLLLALEIEEKETYVKADMFYKRTIFPEIEIISADNAEDALIISLNRYGKVNLEYMSELTGLSIEDMQTELLDKLFYDPGKKAWVDTGDYLSGNVREKLRIAEELHSNELNLKQNISALKEVQPKDLEAHEITVKLGAPWVPADDIREFVAFLLDITSNDATVEYSSTIATWDLNVRRANTTRQTKTYGTDRMQATDILLRMLNQQEIKIFDIRIEDGKERRVLNKEETLNARHKKEQIAAEFSKWIYEDPARRNRLTRIYNEKFNCIRERRFSGDILTFPGMNGTIKLRKNQLEAIERIVFTGNTLLAHKVGAGKTFTLVASAMKLKQVGLCKKPMIVVPNHLINQWAAEFIRLYPTAKVLAATKDDFEKDKRKRLFARIATGDYDAIIIAHSSFKMINVNQENLEAFIQDQIIAIEEAMIASSENDKYSGMIRRLESTKKRLEAEMERLISLQKKDDFLCFEQLGIDGLFVDEAHEFKNLFVYTKMGNVSGIPQSRSQKAFDLFVKSQYIINKFGNSTHGLIFATGTPISNSMVELFTMQRYMQLSTLERMGLSHFDAWASNFGESVTALELSPDGSGYRMKTRFRKFINLPELMTLYKQFADIRTGSTLKLPVPTLKGGKPTVIECEPSEALKEFIETLVERTERIHAGAVDPRDDNMLKITSEGKKAALSLKLMLPDEPIDENEKVVRAAKEIFVRYQKYNKEKLTQLVFCDLSTPKKDEFNIYDELKRRLMDKGIPEKEIAFIHDANTDKQKEQLFKKVNKGVIRVLMGSTSKMGAGTNVQQKMVSIHHLDAPWRPADIEQRNGRLLRPGNKCLDWNIEVEILTYVTRQSFDAYSWQTLETKARFIDQIMTGDITVRTAEDIENSALNYAEVKAIASGNPLVMRKMEVDNEVQQLSVLRAMYNRDKYRMQDELSKLPQVIQKSKDKIDRYQKDIQRYMLATSYDLKVFNSTFRDEDEAGQALKELAKYIDNDKTQKHGEYFNFDLHMYKEPDYYEGHKIVMSLVNPDTGSEHKAEVSNVGKRNIERLDNILKNFEIELDDAKQKLDVNTRSYESMKDEVNKPFEHEERYNTLLKEQQEIDAQFEKDKESDEIIAEEETA